MSTKKAISTSFVAIFILIITQIIAQSIASMFVIIKIPTGICNIIAGIIYAGLTYLILKMFISKIIKLPTSDFGMPKFAIKMRWILIAVLLPFVIKGSYLLIFNGKYVSSNMNGNQRRYRHLPDELSNRSDRHFIIGLHTFPPLHKVSGSFHPPFCQIFQYADNKKATRLSQDSCVAKR